jgi:hypothetical protein
MDVERDVKVLQGFPEPRVLRLVQVMAQLRVLFDDVSEEVVGCAGVSHCDVRVQLHLDTGTG